MRESGSTTRELWSEKQTKFTGSYPFTLPTWSVTPHSLSGNLLGLTSSPTAHISGYPTSSNLIEGLNVSCKYGY